MRLSRVVMAVTSAALVPSLLWAQEHEAPAGGDLFNINTGLSTWTLIVFAGLLFILGRYAWGPILGAVEAREKGIQSSLDEAKQRNEEAAALLAEHREQLADARRQAHDLIAEGRAAGEGVRQEIEEKARAEGQAIVERARGEIERERDAALEALRRESVELALAAASRLMQENLDQAKDRQLVERYLSGLGSGGGASA